MGPGPVTVQSGPVTFSGGRLTRVTKVSMERGLRSK